MKLIRTHDGLMGWNIDGKVIWCGSRSELDSIGWAHAGRLNQIQRHQFIRDVDYAIDHMAKTGHTIAEFGIMGTFMYTTTEPEYEF